MKRTWNRLNVIVGYPLLLVIDLLIGIFGPMDFFSAHAETIRKLNDVWYRQ